MNMKNRRSLLVIVLFSFLTFGVANALLTFKGVLNPSILVVQMDSVTFPLVHGTWVTWQWHAEPGELDTFNFDGLPSPWPGIIGLYGTANAFPFHESIISPIAGIWYPLVPGPPTPTVMFYGDYGVQETKPAIERIPRLNVNPSVVTGQMTVKLQPVGRSGPIVQIHDAVGKVVRSLCCTAGADGFATATWNREDEFGQLAPAGVYFCRYDASDVVAVRKVLVAP